jgi:hypothetical protein
MDHEHAIYDAEHNEVLGIEDDDAQMSREPGLGEHGGGRWGFSPEGQVIGVEDPERQESRYLDASDDPTIGGTSHADGDGGD